MRKLQCISETCASPIRRPRQPAASISCQALRWFGVPGGSGFLKVEPPVRLFTGCAVSRCCCTASIVRADRLAVLERALVSRLDEDEIVGRGGVAVGVAHVGIGEDVALAAPVDRHDLDDALARLDAVGAGIHPERAADAAGDAVVEGEAADARLQRVRRDALVGERRADAEAVALDLALAEAARREPHDDARARRRRGRGGWSRGRRR